MSNYLLYDPFLGHSHFGNTKAEAVQASSTAKCDLDTRVLTVKAPGYREITVDYGDSWTRGELLKDMHNEALKILCQRLNWRIYRLERV